MIFGPSLSDGASSGPSDPNHGFGGSCASTLTGAVSKCSGMVSNKEGESYTWTVTRKDTYELAAMPAKGKKYTLNPQLIVERDGEELANVEGYGESAKTSLELEPGTYSLQVKSVGGYVIKGGFSFDLQIDAQNPEPVAAPLVAEGDDAAPVSKKDALKAKLAALKAKKAGKNAGKNVPAEKVVVAEAAPEVPALEPVAVQEPVAAPVAVVAVPEIDLTPAPVEPEPVQEPVAAAELELEISAKNLSTLAVDMNKACGSMHCKRGFQYIFTNLSCDKTARWCQLDLTAMERSTNEAFVATLPFTPAAKTRSAFDAATDEALRAFEDAPKSGRLAAVVMQAEKKPVVAVAAKRVVVAEPLAKKSAPVATRTVAVAPKAQPAPIAAPAPAPVKAAPIKTSSSSPAPVIQRANKNMAD